MSLSTEDLKARSKEQGLHGVVAHWDDIGPDAPWLIQRLEWREAERARRSLEQRIRMARIGSFKALADFDWIGPMRRERGVIDELAALRFMADTANALVLGPNGFGKSTIEQTVADEALLAGPHRALLNDQRYAQ
jgi:DNA replication protein DnaC